MLLIVVSNCGWNWESGLWDKLFTFVEVLYKNWEFVVEEDDEGSSFTWIEPIFVVAGVSLLLGENCSSFIGPKLNEEGCSK